MKRLILVVESVINTEHGVNWRHSEYRCCASLRSLAVFKRANRDNKPQSREEPGRELRRLLLREVSLYVWLSQETCTEGNSTNTQIIHPTSHKIVHVYNIWKWRMIIAVNFPTEALGKKPPEKKIRVSTGFEPETFAIPVRCSTNWAMKPHIGSEVN